MVTVSRGGIEGRQTSVAVSDFNNATTVWMVVPIHGVPDHLVSFLNQFNKVLCQYSRLLNGTRKFCVWKGWNERWEKHVSSL
jgi:hypothetical protein